MRRRKPPVDLGDPAEHQEGPFLRNTAVLAAFFQEPAVTAGAALGLSHGLRRRHRGGLNKTRAGLKKTGGKLKSAFKKAAHGMKAALHGKGASKIFTRVAGRIGGRVLGIAGASAVGAAGVGTALAAGAVGTVAAAAAAGAGAWFAMDTGWNYITGGKDMTLAKAATKTASDWRSGITEGFSLLKQGKFGQVAANTFGWYTGADPTEVAAAINDGDGARLAREMAPVTTFVAEHPQQAAQIAETVADIAADSRVRHGILKAAGSAGGVVAANGTAGDALDQAAGALQSTPGAVDNLAGHARSLASLKALAPDPIPLPGRPGTNISAAATEEAEPVG
ncbi:MAG: hypothetical protein AB7H77_08630 [Bdellovibrionales bacterium]